MSNLITVLSSVLSSTFLPDSESFLEDLDIENKVSIPCLVCLYLVSLYLYYFIVIWKRYYLLHQGSSSVHENICKLEEIFTILRTMKHHLGLGYNFILYVDIHIHTLYQHISNHKL